jgi:hypothetical protein
MSGSLYIWFMLGFFLLTVGIVLALTAMLWIGHWAEKRETGSTHGFLELPRHNASATEAQSGTEDAQRKEK